MSIPLPGGATALADDRTDDPLVDITLTSSSTSSSRSRPSRPSLSGPRFSGSPLRRMHFKNLKFNDDNDDAEFVFDDDAFDDMPTLKLSRSLIQLAMPSTADNTLNARAPRASSATSPSSLCSLQASAAVMGHGLAGVGTITRLGGGGVKPLILTGSVKARARAMEKAWEADVDFDSGAADFERKSNKFSITPRWLFTADALDDLSDLEDDDQATLKANMTLEEIPPPPRRRDDLATFKHMPPGVTAPPESEDDLESVLVLPPSLTNLSLPTQSQPRMVRARASMAGTAACTATDWDSPSTPSTSGQEGRYHWGSEAQGRNSDTSFTSASDSPKHKVLDHDDFEDDYEDDLEFPEPAFFSTQNASKLNKILDRKRKQQYAPPAQALRPNDNRSDDSFEDGLVFDDPRAELSHRRLEKNMQDRAVSAPFSLGTERKTSGGPTQVSATMRHPPSRGDAITPTGFCTNSVKSRFTSRDTRLRRTSGPSMPAPQVPVPRDTGTPHQLRHQRSQAELAPTPGPVLGCKQSMVSLQDTMAAGRVRPGANHDRFGSGSRLAMPTSSSMAKRSQPVQSVFRDPRKCVVEMPRRRQYGDGTELEGIEDLRVVNNPGRSPGDTLRRRRSLDRISKALHEGADKPARDGDGTKEKRKAKRRPRKQAMLIKNLGAMDKRKVVGEMTWNPNTLRWEGNEGVLRDFGSVTSSARPALIAHFTGSSPATSPVTQAPVRIVGNMKFDPKKMCWVSLLPPEEDEPDPFEGMADDEDSLLDIQGTITRSAARKLISIGMPGAPSSVPSSAMSNRVVSESTSIAQSTASWEDRARPLPIPDELFAECKGAEERHRRELRGWIMRPVASASDARDRERRAEKRLWEVRNLALRS